MKPRTVTSIDGTPETVGTDWMIPVDRCPTDWRDGRPLIGQIGTGQVFPVRFEAGTPRNASLSFRHDPEADPVLCVRSMTAAERGRWDAVHGMSGVAA